MEEGKNFNSEAIHDTSKDIKSGRELDEVLHKVLHEAVISLDIDEDDYIDNSIESLRESNAIMNNDINHLYDIIGKLENKIVTMDYDIRKNIEDIMDNDINHLHDIIGKLEYKTDIMNNDIKQLYYDTREKLEDRINIMEKHIIRLNKYNTIFISFILLLIIIVLFIYASYN